MKGELDRQIDELLATMDLAVKSPLPWVRVEQLTLDEPAAQNNLAEVWLEAYDA